MYPINFMTCTAQEVIARSVTCHPTMFAEELSNVARIHAGAANTMHDRRACDVAAKLARECFGLADRLQVGDRLDTLTFGETISAFSRAAHLQLIPPAVAQAIVDRSL